MRRTSGFQKLLYLIILALGIYILYKAGRILLESGAARQALDAGEVQRNLEDAAMRTYAPGYTATVEGRDMPNWIAKWMRQVVPVYSYLAEGSEGESGAEGQTGEQPGETEKTDQGVEMISQAKGDSGETTHGEETAKEETKKAGQAAESQKKGKQKTGESEYSEDRQETVQKKEEEETTTETGALTAVSQTVVPEQLLAQLEDFDYLLTHYYTVDEGTMADAQLLDADALLRKDLRMAQDPSEPQILIYHTHSQEAFADSREGETGDTIIGMGEKLAEELRDTYGYNVIHDTGIYDLVDGVLDRSAAYDYAREAVEQILAKYPTIEVIIDLHRDGVEGEKFVTEIDGQPVSRIMFFNGISRDSADQPLSWLENPYTQDNLAFSLQLQLAAEELYPGFTRNIYLKAERFNLHLRPRSLLVEAGTQLNTVEEERNAMAPLADLLHRVLSGANMAANTDTDINAAADTGSD